MAQHRLRAIAAALIGIAQPAIAGPPYDTDDPVPTDYHRWEIYIFGDAQTDRRLDAGAAGLDINYGAFPGVQLTATLPINYARGPDGAARPGPVELGVKYRFLHDEAHGFSVAAFPRAIFPTGGRRFDSGRVQWLLPVWAQKDIGHWSLFGGGGMMINPGPGNRNYWQGGIAMTREIASGLSLGVEATRQGPSALGERATTTMGAGATIHLSGPFSLLLSAGPSFTDGSGRAEAHGYAAILLNL